MKGFRRPAGGQPWQTNFATTWRLPTPRSSHRHPRHPYALGTVCPHPPSHFMATHILMQSTLDHPKGTPTVRPHADIREAPLASYYSTCTHKRWRETERERERERGRKRERERERERRGDRRYQPHPTF